MNFLSLGQILGIVVLLIIAGVTVRYRNEIKKFVLETASELKKVSWTTRKDLVDSTWVVIASSAFLAVFIGVVDFILSRIVAVIIK